jgi:hypothetical protein
VPSNGRSSAGTRCGLEPPTGRRLVPDGMKRALSKVMTNIKSLAAVLFLLSSCGPPNPGLEDDGVPGAADSLVGTWQGSGSTQGYSAANGQTNWPISGSLTITRLSSIKVTVDFSELTAVCKGKVIYDVGSDLIGKPEPNQQCDAWLELKGDTLTASSSWSDGAIMQPTTYSMSVTLKRVP